MRIGAEIFHTLRAALKAAGHNTNVGDEGGFAPNLPSADAALDIVMPRSAKLVTSRRRYGAGARLRGEEFFRDGTYKYSGEGKTRSKQEQAKYLADLAARYPIVSIEDGMAEDDMEGWKILTDVLGEKCQLVGDDLFVTNTVRLAEGIKDGIANSILVKVNQIGTLTETLGAVEMAHKAGYTRGDVAPLGRNRGFNHCRSCGRHQLRTDKDRLACPFRSHGQVQPAAAHRGGAGPAGKIRGRLRPQGPNRRKPRRNGEDALKPP